MVGGERGPLHIASDVHTLHTHSHKMSRTANEKNSLSRLNTEKVDLPSHLQAVSTTPEMCRLVHAGSLVLNDLPHGHLWEGTLKEREAMGSLARKVWKDGILEDSALTSEVAASSLTLGPLLPYTAILHPGKVPSSSTQCTPVSVSEGKE